MSTCTKCGTEQAFGVAGHVEHTPERCLTVQLENVTAERDEAREKWTKVETALDSSINWERVVSRAAMYGAERARALRAEAERDALLDWIDEKHPNPGIQQSARRDMKLARARSPKEK
jgi:hypothetical protein